MVGIVVMISSIFYWSSNIRNYYINNYLYIISLVLFIIAYIMSVTFRWSKVQNFPVGGFLFPKGFLF